MSPSNSWAGKTPSTDEWRDILEKHARWIRNEAGSQRAYLQRADLQRAYLRGAYLRGAKNFNPLAASPLALLRDQPGKIRAYKLVNASGEGPFNGGITYEIGKSCEVEHANTDQFIECGAGINVGDLSWVIREWKKGYRILLVEFEAKDIASIPVANDGKFRLYRCAVVGEKALIDCGLESVGDEQEIGA